MTDRLYRSPDDRMLAGVAGGLAENLGIDPSLVRIVWAVLIVLTGGLAFLVYVVMAIVVPERPAGVAVGRDGEDSRGGAGAGAAASPASGAPSPAPSRRTDRSDATRGGLVAGLILILVGGFFLVRQLLPSIDLGFWWPTVAIGLGIVLVVLALLPSRR